MSTATGLLSAEDFAALPTNGMRLELVRGKIRAMPPAIAIPQNGALGSSSVPDEVFLPCQQFIFSQGYPGDFFCLKH